MRTQMLTIKTVFEIIKMYLKSRHYFFRYSKETFGVRILWHRPFERCTSGGCSLQTVGGSLAMLLHRRQQQQRLSKSNLPQCGHFISSANFINATGREKNTHTYTCMYIYIFIFICICMHAEIHVYIYKKNDFSVPMQ